ncbi:MAG: hypothetical protein ACLSFT_12300 [Ruminococcus callidus]
MKQYTADKHAQYTLQIAAPIVTAVLIGWYGPFWQCCPGAVDTDGSAGGGGVLLSHCCPCGSALCPVCIGDHITRKCGIFHTGASHADTGVAVQQHFSGTFADATGMNFIRCMPMAARSFCRF